MNDLYFNEHNCCNNYSRSDHPLIDKRRIIKGDEDELDTINNEIIFVLEGCLECSFNESFLNTIPAGHILFFPVGTHVSYSVLHDTLLIIFRPNRYNHICDNYRLESLYVKDCNITVRDYKPDFVKLKINPCLWQFVAGLVQCLNDGLKCQSFFELKITELLFYLQAYYGKEQLYHFFFPILNPDAIFSEKVRLFCQHDSCTVKELAMHMNLSTRQFSRKFKQAFSTTPYQWIKEKKIKRIWRELTTTDKPIKQIAFDFEFSSLSHFTKFCKDELGNTPSRIRKNL